jgi:hypothetical protein
VLYLVVELLLPVEEDDDDLVEEEEDDLDELLLLVLLDFPLLLLVLPLPPDEVDPCPPPLEEPPDDPLLRTPGAARVRRKTASNRCKGVVIPKAELLVAPMTVGHCSRLSRARVLRRDLGSSGIQAEADGTQQKDLYPMRAPAEMNCRHEESIQ